MASLMRWASTAFRRAPLTPLRFPTSGFHIVDSSKILEEEAVPEFKTGVYCPVTIGAVFASRYQVVGKLGFGVTSTVWLARDLENHGYVALKMFTSDRSNEAEMATYRHLSKHANSSHEGFPHIRTALDTILINHSGVDHFCLVQKPMWDSFEDMLDRNPIHRFTEDLLKAGLPQVLIALDYLHTEGKLIHTGKYIKPANILQDIADESLLEAFVQDEMLHPSPRKFVDGHPIYASQRFRSPKIYGGVVLSDFGSAVSGEVKIDAPAQPPIYRSPEVMLHTEWSYPVDIWNVGVMAWNLFEGKQLFSGLDPLMDNEYTSRAHLAEIVGLLGPPPPDLLAKGKRSDEFFTKQGEWKVDGIDVPRDVSLESSEQFMQGENKKLFLQFLRSMLQWRPEDRKTARELLDDPWLNSPLDDS